MFINLKTFESIEEAIDEFKQADADKNGIVSESENSEFVDSYDSGLLWSADKKVEISEFMNGVNLAHKFKLKPELFSQNYIDISNTLMKNGHSDVVYGTINYWNELLDLNLQTDDLVNILEGIELNRIPKYNRILVSAIRKLVISMSAQNISSEKIGSVIRKVLNIKCSNRLILFASLLFECGSSADLVFETIYSLDKVRLPKSRVYKKAIEFLEQGLSVDEMLGEMQEYSNLSDIQIGREMGAYKSDGPIWEAHWSSVARDRGCRKGLFGDSDKDYRKACIENAKLIDGFYKNDKFISHIKNDALNSELSKKSRTSLVKYLRRMKDVTKGLSSENKEGIVSAVRNAYLAHRGSFLPGGAPKCNTQNTGLYGYSYDLIDSPLIRMLNEGVPAVIEDNSWKSILKLMKYCDDGNEATVFDKKTIALYKEGAIDTVCKIHEKFSLKYKSRYFEGYIAINDLIPARREELLELVEIVSKYANVSVGAVLRESQIWIQLLLSGSSKALIDFVSKWKFQMPYARINKVAVGIHTLSALSVEERDSVAKSAIALSKYGYELSFADIENLMLIAELNLADFMGPILINGKTFPRHIEYEFLRDSSYRRLVQYIGNKRIKKDMQLPIKNLLSYLVGMNYPYNKSTETIDWVLSLNSAVKIFKVTVEEIWNHLGRDYSSSDREILDIDVVDYSGRLFSDNVVNKFENVIMDYDSLHVLDPNNLDSLQSMLALLRTIGKFRIGALMKSMDFFKFEEYVLENSVYDVINKIDEISNKTYPYMQKTLSGYVSLNESHVEAFKEYVSYSAQESSSVINVNVENMAKINMLVRILEVQAHNDKTKMIRLASILVPELSGAESSWIVKCELLRKIDISSVSAQNIQEFSQYLDLVKLRSFAVKYKIDDLEEKIQSILDNIDLKVLMQSLANDASLDFEDLKIDRVDEIREMINVQSDRVYGDRFVIEIGRAFFNSNPISYDNLNVYLEFAKTWRKGITFTGSIFNRMAQRDVQGIYKIVSNFAYTKIVSFLYQELGNGHDGRDRVEEELARINLSLVEIERLMNREGVAFHVKDGNFAKAVNRISNPNYVLTRASQKIFGGDGSIEGLDGSSLVRRDWKTLPGVDVYAVKIGDKDVATIIKCDRKMVGVDLLMDSSGSVNYKAEKNKRVGKNVFAGALAFATDDNKMTEIAIDDGRILNYLVSVDRQDGFILADQDGHMKMLNKRRLKISDLMSLGDAQNNEDYEDRHLNIFQNLEDFIYFLDTMKKRKLSVLANMLLVDDGKLDDMAVDGATSRRLFVEFDDGSIGILSSSKNMSSLSMTEIAMKVGVRNAIYMDTVSRNEHNVSSIGERYV